jgi:hypothetical protein
MQPFLPDRFYLNESPFLRDEGSQHLKSDFHCARKFSCGRYLDDLHRSNESILCVVLSTYRLDWNYFQEEFSILTNKVFSIPTLILHGDKREEVSSTIVDEKVQEESPIPTVNEIYKCNSHMDIWEVRPQHSSSSAMPSISKNILGVHHPKYMIVCTTAGLHVSIGTANLTRNGSVDATWTQFFPRSRNENSQNDFADVLEDFLIRVSLLIVYCPMA